MEAGSQCYLQSKLVCAEEGVIMSLRLPNIFYYKARSFFNQI